ncbi:MAG TPA: hypothetical protein VEL76_02715 [Gemmataceae bacterium]|nr:hypothetical protein [Gemmataceae bacterium]
MEGTVPKATMWSSAGRRPARTAVSCRGMSRHRFRDGRLVEGWDSWNVGGLVRHLEGE